VAPGNFFTGAFCVSRLDIFSASVADSRFYAAISVVWSAGLRDTELSLFHHAILSADITGRWRLR
jgi:hypothetical protein